MKTFTVKLKTPIKRGETEISEIELQEPTVMALQELEVNAVIRGDVAQLVMLLPRITDLTEQEVKSLSFANIAAFSMRIVNFLA